MPSRREQPAQIHGLKRLTPKAALWHHAPVTNWKVLRERVVLERKWLTITEQRVALPRNVELEFHLVSSPDWTSVLALTPERQVVVVEQYRHALQGISRELPAGVIDPGETPLQAAKRELLEETGYASDDWRVLSVVRTEPVRHHQHRTFLFRGWRRAHPRANAHGGREHPSAARGCRRTPSLGRPRRGGARNSRGGNPAGGAAWLDMTGLFEWSWGRFAAARLAATLPRGQNAASGFGAGKGGINVTR